LLYVHIRSNTEEMLKKDCSTVLRSYEKAYVINKDSIAEISSDLEKISEEWEINFKQAFMINFVVEEVILNIIKFAVDKEKKECSIAIRLVDDQGEYIMRIRDDVADYNPFESDGDEIDHAVLKMIQKKTKYCDYQRKLIFNYLYLIL
jgi:two-component sensor histidine kinase